jgi:hypothetical protein
MDDAGNLMTERDDGVDRERRNEAAVDQMDVGQAHPRGPHLDQHLPRAGGGHGDLFDGERVGVQTEPPGKHGLHGGTSILPTPQASDIVIQQCHITCSMDKIG